MILRRDQITNKFLLEIMDFVCPNHVTNLAVTMRNGYTRVEAKLLNGKDLVKVIFGSERDHLNLIDLVKMNANGSRVIHYETEDLKIKIRFDITLSSAGPGLYFHLAKTSMVTQH